MVDRNHKSPETIYPLTCWREFFADARNILIILLFKALLFLDKIIVKLFFEVCCSKGNRQHYI